MAKNRTAKVISKKHLARLERERRQIRAIVGVAIAVLVIVVGMIVYGALYQSVFQPAQRVVRVYDETIHVREFQTVARLRRQEIISNYIQNYSFALMFGSTDPTTDPNWSDSLQRIASQLYDTDLGPYTMTNVVEKAFLRHYAAENGITITQEDIDQAIRKAFRYYPEGTPTPAPTATTFAYPTLSATELSMVTLTPTRTPYMTPTPDPSATPQPTATPTVVPTPTEIPTPTATPTEYTLEGFQSEYQDTVAYYQEAINLSEQDFVQYFFTDQLYRSEIYDIITADVPHEQEQVWARHILVADEATALTVRALLLSGEDFATVASQYSTDTGSAAAGGDLGWFGRGAMVSVFEEAAFSLAPGEISQPVQSQYGYHIIQVIAHQNRPLTDDEYKSATDQAFQDWLDAQIAAAVEAGDIVYYIQPDANNQKLWDITPNEPDLQAALNALLAQMYATPTPAP